MTVTLAKAYNLLATKNQIKYGSTYDSVSALKGIRHHRYVEGKLGYDVGLLLLRVGFKTETDVAKLPPSWYRGKCYVYKSVTWANRGELISHLLFKT